MTYIVCTASLFNATKYPASFMITIMYMQPPQNLIKTFTHSFIFIVIKQTDVPLRHRLVKLEKRSNMRDGPSLLSIILKIPIHEIEADIS